MFTIDGELNISYNPDPVEAREDVKTFDTQQELAKRLEGQTRTQLAQLWNTFAGVPPFGDLKSVRPSAVSPAALIRRVWDAIQRLRGDEPGPIAEPGGAREGSKKALVMGLISRENGASLTELMEKTGWQKHSIRGLVSTLGSKHGFKTRSEQMGLRGLVYTAA